MARSVFLGVVLSVQRAGCASLVVGSAQAVTTNLSLRACVEQTLRGNYSIEVSELGREIAEWNRRREWAAFEPEMTGSARRERNERQNTVEESRSQLSPFFEEQNNVYDAGLQGLFFSGANYRLGYSLSDFANNLTNLTFQNEFDSQYQSFAGASITQPLLKGAGPAATLAAVRLAGVQSEIALQDLRSQMMSAVAQTEAAYWDLVLAQEVYKLRGESVRIAQEILRDNEERVRTGKMSDLEIGQAKSGVAERRIRKQETLRALIEATSRLYTLFSESAHRHNSLILAVDAARVQELGWDFDEGMAVATRLQPDYQRARHEIAQEDVRLRFAKRQRWPQIDLVGSYGYNGLAESVGDSWGDVKDGHFESWSIGAQLAIGLGGGQRSRSELKAARLRKQQALLGMKQVEIEISNALDAGLRQLEILRQTIEDYAAVADFNQRLLDVELERLAAGKSNSRRVLEIEEELFEAKNAQNTSLNHYQKTLVQLRLVIGKTLEEWGVELMDVAREAIAVKDDDALDQPVARAHPPRDRGSVPLPPDTRPVTATGEQPSEEETPGVRANLDEPMYRGRPAASEDPAPAFEEFPADDWTLQPLVEETAPAGDAVLSPEVVSSPVEDETAEESALQEEDWNLPVRRQ